jgi:hypothetical protein
MATVQCASCAYPIPVHGDRLPPWCPQCGADLKAPSKRGAAPPAPVAPGGAETVPLGVPDELVEVTPVDNLDRQARRMAQRVLGEAEDAQRPGFRISPWLVRLLVLLGFVLILRFGLPLCLYFLSAGPPSP